MPTILAVHVFDTPHTYHGQQQASSRVGASTSAYLLEASMILYLSPHGTAVAQWGHL